MIIIILQAYLRHTLKTGAPRFRLKVGNAGCMWRLIGWPPKKPIKKHNCRLQRACTRCLIDSDVDCRTPATAVRDHQQAGREAGYPGRPVRLNRIIGEPDWRTEAGSLKHQLAAIHADACAKSLQDRGSTPLASTFSSSPSELNSGPRTWRDPRSLFGCNDRSPPLSVKPAVDGLYHGDLRLRTLII